MTAISLEPLLELLNKHNIVPGKNGRVLEEFEVMTSESDADIPY
jgi:hypothetical protein